MFAVVVDFTIKAGRLQEFLPLMYDNASTSLQKEDACFRFDVCTSSASDDQVMLYELYADRAAFDLHLRSDHFVRFTELASEFVDSKVLRCFETVVGSRVISSGG